MERGSLTPAAATTAIDGPMEVGTSLCEFPGSAKSYYSVMQQVTIGSSRKRRTAMSLQSQ